MNTLAKTIGAAALLVSSTAFSSTVGTLTYDATAGKITDSATGTYYLGWDLAAPLTYAETLLATQAGGLYEEYHIASQTEAYAFFNAAMAGIATHTDTPGSQYITQPGAGFVQDMFGNNGSGLDSSAWFLSDEVEEAGILTTYSGSIDLDDNWGSIASTDALGALSGPGYVTWLLVSDDNLSPVPVPAALPLFATALAAFGWMRRRKQLKAV